MAFKKYTIKDIRLKIEKTHGEIVSLDESTYTNIYTRARFIDKDFGEWWADPRDVLSGGGHLSRFRKERKLSKPEILDKLKAKNELVIDIDYDTYSRVGAKAKFIDKDFGEFWAKASMVISGNAGHPKRHKHTTLPLKDVVKKLFKVHGDIIKIIEDSYVAVSKNARFVDKDFGEFEKTVSCVLAGQGCKKRYDYKRKYMNARKNTLEDMAKLADKNGGTVVSLNYINSKTKLMWKCKNEHVFEQTPNDVQSGHWCAVCKTKTQQALVDIFKEIFPREVILSPFRKLDWLKNRSKLEVDIYLPDIKLAIEYDGEQHFTPVMWDGSKKKAKERYLYTKHCDKLKNKLIRQHIKNGGQDIKYFIRFNYKEKITKEYVIEKLKAAGVGV